VSGPTRLLCRRVPANDPCGRVTVQASTVGPEEDRSLQPLADGQIDRPRSTGRERNDDDLAALAEDGQGAVTAFETESVDVSPGRFGHPQPVEDEDRDQGVHWRNGDCGMWAQLITTRMKPGREEDLPSLYEQLRAAEQPGTGLLRSTAMRDQNNPSRVYMLVVFESEEKARARENDPRRQEGLQTARATMAEIFDGPPEFVHLIVVDETSP
jgi:quinol monooxygenase YgiN